jgi:single-strand DNA-binding protein
VAPTTEEVSSITVEHQHDPDEPGSRTRWSRPPEGAEAETPTPEPEPELEVSHRNEVVLVGRITSPLRRRGLPSGDVLGTLRIVVDRSGQPRAGRKSAGFDAIDCASWSPKAHKKLEKWIVGDVIQVSGSLRRRFFRANNIPTSRYEVEIQEAQLLAPAAQVPTRPRNKEKQPGATKPDAA